MERSFKKVYGLGDGFQGIEMMGRTDPAILREALTNRGLEWRGEEAEHFRETYYKFLEEEIEIPRPGKRLCSGILSLLESLQGRSDVVLSLLTGNWRASAYLKLRHFGIDEYFTIGVFADDSPRRDDLVPIAMERLDAQEGVRVAKANVYVIGDTPLDIRCAKPHGVRTVGVATGFHSLEELAVEEPDYLFPNFENTEKVVEIFCQS